MGSATVQVQFLTSSDLNFDWFYLNNQTIFFNGSFFYVWQFARKGHFRCVYKPGGWWEWVADACSKKWAKNRVPNFVTFLIQKKWKTKPFFFPSHTRGTYTPLYLTHAHTNIQKAHILVGTCDLSVLSIWVSLYWLHPQ